MTTKSTCEWGCAACVALHTMVLGYQGRCGEAVGMLLRRFLHRWMLTTKSKHVIGLCGVHRYAWQLRSGHTVYEA
jgi:hypothetical protein